MGAHILITNHQCQTLAGHVTCSADYLLIDEAGGSKLLHRVAFRFAWEGHFPLVGGEAFMTVGLFPAMRLGLPVVSTAPAAGEFVENADRLQDIILTWFPGNNLTKVPFSAPERPLLEPHGRGTVALFSGGVDSFHTAHRHHGSLDRLLYIDGFDTDLYQTKYRTTASRQIEAAAGELGLPLLTVETDARLFLDKYVRWGLCATTVSGAVIQLFQGVFRRALVGSSHRWDVTYILADGYLLTQQFGLPDLDLVVDALDVNRHGKVLALRDSPAALRHLRVCWEMPGDRLNCGRCEKCLRTMVALDSVGLLQQCATFPHAIDWARIDELDLSSDRSIRLWDMTRRNTTAPELRARLDEILIRARTRRAAMRLWESGKILTAAKGWPVLARKLGKPLLATVWQTDPEWLLKKCRQQLDDLKEGLWEMLKKQKPGLIRRLATRVLAAAKKRSTP